MGSCFGTEHKFVKLPAHSPSIELLSWLTAGQIHQWLAPLLPGRIFVYNHTIRSQGIDRSPAVKTVRNTLNNLRIRFTRNMTFQLSSIGQFDFYLPEYNILIDVSQLDDPVKDSFVSNNIHYLKLDDTQQAQFDLQIGSMVNDCVDSKKYIYRKHGDINTTS